jgi:hypothetical protein
MRSELESIVRALAAWSPHRLHLATPAADRAVVVCGVCHARLARRGDGHAAGCLWVRAAEWVEGRPESAPAVERKRPARARKGARRG